MLFVFITYTDVQHEFLNRWCSCRLTITWQVWHVEQELLALQEHLSSPPVVIEVRAARSLLFYVMFCISLFVLFPLAIVLSVLRFMDSDCLFGVFGLFLVIVESVNVYHKDKGNRSMFISTLGYLFVSIYHL